MRPEYVNGLSGPQAFALALSAGRENTHDPGALAIRLARIRFDSLVSRSVRFPALVFEFLI